MIWDNAAGHCCAAVKIWLSRPKCHIHLIQLPTYCPHLNPIERLWAVLACPNRFYTAQKQFTKAILPCLQKKFPKNGRVSEVRSQTALHHLSPKLSGFGITRAQPNLRNPIVCIVC
ncbi:MAG: hypothetical protein HOL77_00005 [Rhodobacteraceae bacterium]|nr:hypothetical protein [Paracoccaceae bacterium]